MFFQADYAAITTSSEKKRRAMGLVVAQAAAGDDARVEESKLLLDALRDLDSPHFAVLARVEVAGEDGDAVREVTAAAPEPVIAALVRQGLVETSGTWDGGLVVTVISKFGRKLLTYVRY